MASTSPPICPFDASPCLSRCAPKCRKWQGLIPLDTIYLKAAIHFVGFHDIQQFENACQVFGKPDFVHYTWDRRAQADIVPCLDKVVFAKYYDQPPSEFNYDDSNQPDDPAAAERNH